MTAEAIQKAYERFIEAQERHSVQGQRQYVYASAWAACTRQMAFDMLRPDAKKPFPVDTLANFRRGRDRERDLLADLTRGGRECEPPFEVIGGQERFEIKDKKGRIEIVGKVDARLKFAGEKGSAPLEIKSYHPTVSQAIKRFEDMFIGRWTRKGAHQLLAYLLASNEPLGFLLLDRPGIPRPLEVRLYDHLDKAEDFLARAEVALDATEDGAPLPPYIDDPAECRVCDFYGHTCQPPLAYDAATIITDEETVWQTERYAELDELPEIQEHTRLEKWAKERYRGVEQAIAGKCVVEGKPRKTTKTVFPDEATKLKYQVSDPKGGWITTITKVSK